MRGGGRGRGGDGSLILLPDTNAREVRVFSPSREYRSLCLRLTQTPLACEAGIVFARLDNQPQRSLQDIFCAHTDSVCVGGGEEGGYPIRGFE
jgi:hypothetical protein